MTTTNMDVPGEGTNFVDNKAIVYIVEMHGSFTLAAARVRRGESARRGTVLRLLLDAHTGALVGRSLASEVQAPLQDLRPVEDLG